MIKVRAVRDDRRVRLSVDDRGIGIVLEMLHHVCEAFCAGAQRSLSVSWRARHGPAFVRSLVELHDGAVMVRGEGLNLGSTFGVELLVDDSVVVQSGEQAVVGGER